MFAGMLLLTTLLFQTSTLEEVCVSQKVDTFFVSDRYRDVVQVDQYLYFANEYGVIVKDMNDPSPEPLAAVALGGDIQNIQYNEGMLYAYAVEDGLYRLRFHENDPVVPEAERFYAFEGLQTAYALGDRLIVATETALRLYVFKTQPNRFELIDTLLIAATSVVMDAHNVYFLTPNNQLNVLNYDLENGFATLTAGQAIQNNSDFYRVDYRADVVVLESLDGVIWARFGVDGALQASGRYFNNAGKNIVLASDVSEDHLALRLPDRIEIYQIDSSQGLLPVGGRDVPFNELAFTDFSLSNGSLYFLNQAQSGRAWSYRRLAFDNPGAGMLEVPARYDQVVGAAVVGDTVLVGSGQALLRLNETGDALTLAYDLKQPLVEMLGIDNRIYTLSQISDSTNMQFSVFDVDDAGVVAMVFSKRYAGSLKNLTSYEKNAAFVRNFRHLQGDDYTVHVILGEEDAAFTEETLDFNLAINEPSPFESFRLTEAGLIYKSGSQITLHNNLRLLSKPLVFNEPSGRNIIEMTFAKEHFWIETQDGLSVMRPVGEDLEEVSLFQSWQDIRPLNNDSLIGRNVLDLNPGAYHLLRLDNSGFMRSAINFSTSEDPILIREQASTLLVAEKASLSSFDLVCPDRRFEYLIPYREDFELELLPITEQEVVTFTILNVLNETIGEQRMSSDILEITNGQPLSNWLFDYNRLEEPAAVNVSASEALSPILSGYASSDPRSRFAFQVQESTSAELFVTHIPSDFKSWNTSAFIRNKDEGRDTNLQLIGPDGPWWTQSTPAGSTEWIRFTEDLNENVAPPSWAIIASNNINTKFSGFALFEDRVRGQAAAYPLTGEPSDFLIMPYLKGTKDPKWRTGMTIANHNIREVTLRLVGYDAQALPVTNTQLTVQGQSKIVVIAEDLLAELADGDKVQWFAIVAGSPLTGVALITNQETGQLAALPMTARTGKTLSVNGIRNPDEWWHALVVTNTDTLPGQILIRAIDEHDLELDKVVLNIIEKDVLELDLETLFPDLPRADRIRMRALKIESELVLTGFMLRGSTTAESLEAFSFYTRGF